MSSDWDKNAKAWIEHVGVRGDFSREYVLDPVMLARVQSGFLSPRSMSAAARAAFAGSWQKKTFPPSALILQTRLLPRRVNKTRKAVIG